MNPEESYMPQVLIVDDIEANIDVLVEILCEDYDLRVATSGADALEAVADTRPELILLDVMMPEMNGYEVCKRLKSDPKTAKIPIIFVTAMNEAVDESKGLEMGAVDYITKPIVPFILQARVRNHLALADQQRACERTVEAQVAEIEQGQTDCIHMLGNASHYNDDDTGVHIWRMAAYSKALAKAVHWSVEDQELLVLAAAMHDTGKIGIPDAVLKKPGRLNDEEWAIMRTHSEIGYKILSISQTPVFQMAAAIAYYHHERWDGNGYPKGLKGEDIPESARIVAIADVFDALTSARPYKDPWPVDKAYAVICEESGQFDPGLSDGFLSIRPEIERLMAYWRDQENEDDVFGA